MKLPFFKKNSDDSKMYLGVLLKQDDGILMLLKNSGGQLQLIDQERVMFTNGWDTLTEDIDSSLSILEKRNNTHVQDTIFYVYTSLIDVQTKAVQKYYLDRIKGVVKSLDLKALGFIECYEGVAAYYEKKEELPLTATIIEIDTKALSVFVYTGGKNIFSHMISRTDEMTQDLTSVFLSVKNQHLLPSRFILYNIGDISEEVTHIMSHKWGEDIFVQLPKLELVKKEDLFESLVYIFGKEINSPTESEPEVAAEASPLVVPEVKKEEPQEVLGFKINQDVTEINPEVAGAIPVLTMDDLPRPEKVSSKKKFTMPSFSPKMFISPRMIPVIGIILIILGLILNELLLHKAEVVLFFPSEKISKNLDLTVPIGEGEDLNVYVATDSAEFTASTATTGKKDIGERAKGEVTVSNFDDKEKIFVKGTTLEASGHTFKTDDEVKVASASFASDKTAKLPGKAKVKITATDIGTESNLDKGQQFKIEDLSVNTYFATNDNALSGGTKKSVNVVSKKDLDNLKVKLLDKADTNAKDMNAEVHVKGNVVLKDLEKKTLDKLSFSKDVDDEASNVTAKGNVLWTAYYMKDEELKKYIDTELAKDIDGNGTLQKEKLAYELKNIKRAGNNVKLDIVAKGSSVKEINTEEIKNNLPLKNTSSLEALKSKYGLSKYEVHMQQPLFFLNQFMPPMKKNITVKISYL
jgi:hypothetical protein